MTPGLIQWQIERTRLDRLAHVDLLEWVKTRLIELDEITARLREIEAQLALKRGQIADFVRGSNEPPLI